MHHRERFALDLIGQAEGGVHDGPDDGPGAAFVPSGAAYMTRPTPEDPFAKFGLDTGQFGTVPTASIDQSPQDASISGGESKQLPGGEKDQFSTGQALGGQVDGAVEGGEAVQDQGPIEVVKIGEMLIDPLSTDARFRRDGGDGKRTETVSTDDGGARFEELHPPFTGT